MEKCIYDNQIIYAQQVNLDIKNEQQVRKLSRLNKLKCADIDCSQIVYYKHGDKRIAHFAHKQSLRICEYEKFYSTTKKRNELMKKIIAKVFEVIKGKYSDCVVNMEIKVIKSFWTDILINNNGNMIAIEFVYKYKPPQYMAQMLDKYEKAQIRLIVIVVENELEQKFENDFNNVKRLQLHLDKEILVMLNEDGYKVKLIKNMFSKELCIFDTTFDKLDLINNEYYCDDFYAYCEKFKSQDIEPVQNLQMMNIKGQQNAVAITKEDMKDCLSYYFNNSGPTRKNASKKIELWCEKEQGLCVFKEIYEDSQKSGNGMAIKIKVQFNEIIEKCYNLFKKI